MKISVIIPTYNEASVIQRTIDAVRDRSSSENIQEVLVVDGGSSDATVQLARASDVQVLSSAKKGRGVQLDEGGRAAEADILYFLHADSIPPLDFDKDILDSVVNEKKAGCFQMRFDRKELVFRFYGWATRFRSIICRGGDQSLFMTKELYDQLGGFNAQLKIFEDIDMIERIRKVTSFAILPKYVTTSARKYEVNGFYRLQFYFAMLHLKYRSGSTPEQLLQYYNAHVR